MDKQLLDVFARLSSIREELGKGAFDRACLAAKVAIARSLLENPATLARIEDGTEHSFRHKGKVNHD